LRARRSKVADAVAYMAGIEVGSRWSGRSGQRGVISVANGGDDVPDVNVAEAGLGKSWETDGVVLRRWQLGSFAMRWPRCPALDWIHLCRENLLGLFREVGMTAIPHADE
jgi:hypothetical protein